MKKVRSQFSERVPVRLKCGPSLTQQHFAEEVNINNIVAKYRNGGGMPMATNKQEFGYATSQSFTEAMFLVAKATEEFGKLPSEVRNHFDNSPAKYLDRGGEYEADTKQEDRRKPVSAPSEASPVPAEPEKAPPSS